MNVLSAVLTAMKSMGEIRNAKIEGEELQKANINLIIPFLNSEKVLLKCLAIETLGQLAQAVGEPQVCLPHLHYHILIIYIYF